MKSHNKIIIGTMLLTLTGFVSAADRPSRGAPPEAIEACANQEVDSQCQMTTLRGDVEGQCKTTPDETLACLPEGHTPGMGGKRGPKSE